MITRLLLTIPLLAAFSLAQTKTAASDDRLAQLYDVGDLAVEVLATAQPNAALARGIGAAKNNQAITGPEPLARLMRAFVKPPLAAKEEIRAASDRWIVAVARPAQHAWIARFLQAARGNTKDLVSIECQCYSVPEITFLRDIKTVLTPLPKDGEVVFDDFGAATSYLTQVLAPGARTTDFLQALQKNDQVTSVIAPILTVEPLNIVTVSVINQTAYVRDFEFEVAKDTVIADPIVDVIQDGILLQTAVSRLENGLLGVSLDAHVAELRRPIETVETTLPGTDHPVTIQLPSLQSTQVEAAVELAADHIVVMALPPLTGKRMLFVVRVKPIKFDELEPAEQPVRRRKLIR